MLRGLTAGFGEPLGTELLEQLRARGVQVIRQDIQIASRERVADLQAELDVAGLRPLWIVGRIEQLEWLPAGAWAEYGNEADLYAVAARDTYIEQLGPAFAAAAAAGVRLSPGAVSNLNDRGYAFLARMIPHVPAEAPIAIHRYPDGDSPTNPHPPASSRDDEVARLRLIIGSRPIWLTEVGYSTAGRGRPWWRFGRGPEDRWTDEQVAAFARYELAFWEGHGAEIAVWFQLNDGPSDAMEHRFGIRRIDGSWKPVAEVFAC